MRMLRDGRWLSYFLSLPAEVFMADRTQEGFQLSGSLVEKLYVQKALELLRASLKRSVANEIPGSEISILRFKEIQALDALMARLG